MHGFISVDGRRVTSPGMLVTKEVEEKISYYKPIKLEEEPQPEENEEKGGVENEGAAA